MAYTVPVLDCTPERVACYFVDPLDLSNDDPLTNPLTAANLPRVLWHSDFDYFEVHMDETVSVTFPAETATPLPRESITWSDVNGVNVYTEEFSYRDWSPFTAFSFASVPYAYLVIGGVAGSGMTTVRAPATTQNAPMRILDPRITSTGLVIREYWRALGAFGFPLESQTISIRAIVFAERAPVSGADMMDLDGSTQRLRLGKALLDTNNTKGFLRESATSTGLAFTVDRALDSVPGGLRRWNLDGSTTTLIGTYTGSYAGPTIRHVTV